MDNVESVDKVGEKEDYVPVKVEKKKKNKERGKSCCHIM